MKLWDPGAQPERTALAWARTTTSLIIAGLLCVRAAPSGTDAAAAAAVVCGGAALLLRISRAGLRARRSRPDRYRAPRNVSTGTPMPRLRECAGDRGDGAGNGDCSSQPRDRRRRVLDR
ncbi:DUF202 domain-containing protein, partial [Actinomadura welshii]